MKLKIFFAAILVFAQTAKASEKLWSEKSPEEIKKVGVDVEALNRAFVNLADTMSPAVVNIYTRTRIASPRMQPNNGMAPDDLFRFFFGNPFGDNMNQPPAREAQALGSGFVINSDGLVVTNSHVVRQSGHNADSISIRFIGENEKSAGWEASVLGVDESSDVAVLKLKKKKPDLKVTPLGDSSKLKVGEWVVAIGNPYGHTHSVTKGIVSALGRSLDEIDRADFIQTDASINPGNSGGPLFNLYGEVVGINTAIDARAQGIGFAIPVNTVKNVVKQLIEKGEVIQGWMGVEMSELTPQVAKTLGMNDSEGVLVQVIPGEPAEKAGVKSYDVITHVNGKKIAGARDFANSVKSLPVGAGVKVRLYREGKTYDTVVTIGKRRSTTEVAKVPARGQNKTEKRTGLYLEELSPVLRRQLQVDPALKGVLVHGIAPASLAAEAGIQPGDVITEINRKPVSTLAQAEAALVNKGNSFLLKLQRRTASLIILLDLSQKANQGE